MLDIKCVRYTTENKQIWDNFIDNSKMPMFMFKRDFMEYHKDRFTDNSLLFYREDKLMAIYPANIKDNILYSHGGLTYGGFITDKNMKQHHMLDCFTALKEYCQQNNISKVLYKTIPHIYHTYSAEEDLYALFINNAKVAKIEPSTVINYSNIYPMSKGRKAQISRAKREGTKIKESSDFDTFIKLENSVLQEHHNATAVHTAAELELLASRFPQNIKLFCAMYQGKMIAGSVIFIYKDVVHTQYLAADDTAREIGGLDLLIKTMIEQYKDCKKYFDFGISTEDGGRYLNEGLISQKEGFGGRTVAYKTFELKI